MTSHNLIDRGRCDACVNDPKPNNFNFRRRCAFTHGDFNSDNWNCATMSELLQVMYHDDDTTTLYCDDETLMIWPIKPDEGFGYWIIVGCYKTRGRVDTFAIHGSDYDTDLECVEAVLDAIKV